MSGWNAVAPSLTLDGSQDDSGVVVGDDVGVAVLWFVHLQVGVLPCELLTGVDGLEGTREQVRLGRIQTDVSLTRGVLLSVRLV